MGGVMMMDDGPNGAPLQAGAAEESPPSEASRKAGEGASIARNTTIVSGFLLIGRMAGILREVVVARFIGTSAAADAFRFAHEAILQDLFTKFEKLLQPIYIPLFIARRQAEGDESAWRFARIVGTIHLLLLTVISTCGFIFAPLIMTLMAGEYEKLQPGTEGFALAVTFLRMFFPALIIFSLSNLAELTIQAYKHFTIPALAEATRRILLVAGVVAAAAIFRGEGEPTPMQATTCLAWGAVLGCLARLLIQLPKLGRYRQWIRPSLNLSDPDIRRAAILALPLVVGIILAFARNIIEAKFAFGIDEGAYSALKAARKLVDMPWQILGLALSYVIYPFIAELGAKQDRSGMGDALIRVVRVMIFAFAPVMVLFLAVGDPVVRVAFMGGHFDENSVRLTHSALPWYVIGLIAFAVEDPVLKWFYALSDTKTPIALGVLGDLVWMAIAFIGVQRMGLGLPGLAAAFSIQKIVKVAVVLLVLGRRLGGIPFSRVLPFVGQMAVVCAFMGVAVWGTSGVVGPRVPFEGLKHHAVHLAAVFFVAFTVFVVASHLLRIEELRFVTDRLRKKLGR